MALRIKKMSGIEEVNAFLRGGHVGGRDLRRGVYGLHGKTLIFTTPAGTVTFTTPSGSAQEALTLKQIVTQINAVHAGLAHGGRGGQLFLQKATPVAIVVTGASTALPLLGFGDDTRTGVVYNPPGTPPSVEMMVPFAGDGTYHLLLSE